MRSIGGREFSAVQHLRRAARRGMLRLGYDLRRTHAPEWADFTDAQRALCAEVALYTQTPPERVATLADAVEYVIRRGIPGDFVECGVWLGGSAMAIAKTLLRRDVRDRRIWLYDTFGAMPQPDEVDRDLNRDFAGRPPPPLTSDTPHGAYLPAVRKNIESTGYPGELVSYVCGLVEATIPATMPQEIALLRLDTDWYSSTAHELEHLYPRLAPGGVLIVDDYGHYQGARKAADEYFERSPILLTRVDYAARMGVKI
jgi:predicted O-methyltransferase YrrM